MKIKYLKLKYWLLSLIGGMLGMGVAGCSVACEYGCPIGTYHVFGTVTDEEGQPLAGIGVVRQYTNQPEVYKYQDTTDREGHYDVNLYSVPGQEAEVSFSDIDGAENGLYSDTIVTVKSDDFHGGDGNWDEGTTDIRLNVSMRRAE